MEVKRNMGGNDLPHNKIQNNNKILYFMLQMRNFLDENITWYKIIVYNFTLMEFVQF